jgi:hypothetical protein
MKKSQRIKELSVPDAKGFESQRYVRDFTIPKSIPAGRVLVHNHIRHAVDTPSGINGFRAWTQKPSDQLGRCNCGWSGLPHYRVRRMTHAKKFY